MMTWLPLVGSDFNLLVMMLIRSVLIWCVAFVAFVVSDFNAAAAGVSKPGVREMAARLQQIIRDEDVMNNTFRNRDRVRVMEGQLAKETNAVVVWETLPQLADEQLRAGDPQAALANYDRFEKLSAQLGQPLQPRVSQMIAHQKAVCYLRIGEQQNCLTNHTVESCLFPIRQLGVYQRQEGPRQAIRILTEALQQHRGDLKGVWLLNIAYMVIGEYPDQVPTKWRIPPAVFQSEYDIKPFIDVASGAGLDLPGWAGGTVVDDFDGDGLLDVMLSSWEVSTQLRFFRNNGDGSFADRTVEAGLTGEVGGLNMVQADYDNDGWTDVLVLRGAWLGAAGRYPNSLLRNNGDGTFEDVTERTGLLSFHPAQTAVWFDYNADGWLDLFVGNESYGSNYHRCELFRSNGDGTFTECSSESGVEVSSYVKGVVAADFNGDGRPDLYLSSRSGDNYLFRNDGLQGDAKGPKPVWRFTNIAEQAGVTEPAFSFPTAAADFDNDGRPDIIVTGYGLSNLGDIVADYLKRPFKSEKARFFRNKGDGTFEDATEAVGLDKLIFAMAINFGDFDNDGWLDFLTGTGDPDFSTVIPNRAFRNAEGKRFQDVTTSGGLGHLQKGHAISFADIDNDGDQDIFEVIGGAYTDDTYRTVLMKNPGHGNHWLTLRLEGRKSNRSALGARIKVNLETASGTRTVYKTVSSGGSFGASPLRQEIGLGAAKSIRSVEVFWPTTGMTQSVSGLLMDRFYSLREGETNAVLLPLKSFALRPPLEKLCGPPGTILPTAFPGRNK